jgi:hypothetical protein
VTWEQLKVLILIVPNAPVITGIIIVLTFHITIIIIIITVHGSGKRENKELQDKNGNK